MPAQLSDATFTALRSREGTSARTCLANALQKRRARWQRQEPRVAGAAHDHAVVGRQRLAVCARHCCRECHRRVRCKVRHDFLHEYNHRPQAVQVAREAAFLRHRLCLRSGGGGPSLQRRTERAAVEQMIPVPQSSSCGGETYAKRPRHAAQRASGADQQGPQWVTSRQHTCLSASTSSLRVPNFAQASFSESFCNIGAASVTSQAGRSRSCSRPAELRTPRPENGPTLRFPPSSRFQPGQAAGDYIKPRKRRTCGAPCPPCQTLQSPARRLHACAQRSAVSARASRARAHATHHHSTIEHGWRTEVVEDREDMRHGVYKRLSSRRVCRGRGG